MCLLIKLAFLWQNFLNNFLFLYQFCQILEFFPRFLRVFLLLSFFSKCQICKPALVTNWTWPPPDLQAFWGPYLNCALFDHSFKHVSLMSQAVEGRQMAPANPRPDIWRPTFGALDIWRPDNWRSGQLAPRTFRSWTFGCRDNWRPGKLALWDIWRPDIWRSRCLAP